MNIRPACADDLPAILIINRESNPHPWAEQHFQAALDAKQIEVVEQNRQVLAFAIWQTVCDEAELHLLVTHRDYLRCGAASALLESFMCNQPSIRRIVLEVRDGNTPAKNLYTRYGFEPVARRKNYYLLPLEDAVIMEKIC